MSIEVLFTAHSTSVGGRHGEVASSDGVIAVGLTLPKAIGGPETPGRTTPEHLFAAGYAACFGSAVEFIAGQQKVILSSITVDADVDIGARPEGGFGLKAALVVTLPGLEQAQAQALVDAADEICPYSNAVRGNIDVSLTARTA